MLAQVEVRWMDSKMLSIELEDQKLKTPYLVAELQLPW